MITEFWNWLLNAIISTGLIGTAAYFMRDTLGSFFAKAVEHRFEKKLETFKSGIRDNERELEQIRLFLASARRDRDSAIQSKRLEAAETLLRARHGLSQFSMLVEYMKILNTEQILNDSGNPRVAEFIDLLAKPFDIDAKITQIGKIDKTVPRLYLSDKSLKAFDVYESIILNAAIMMRLFSLPLPDKSRLIKTGSLSKTIIELVPISKEGFDKFGEGYAYHWSTYFHDEILRALRHEVSGADDMMRDAQSAERLALDSRRAQINIQSYLEQVGLPDTLFKLHDDITANSLYANKLSE